MKRFLLIAAVLIALSVIGCKSTGTPGTPGTAGTTERDLGGFSDVLEREWKLAEVWIDNQRTGFSRSTLEQGFGEAAFSLKVDREFFGGTAAPNLYSFPYTLGEGQAISLMMGRSTLMAPIIEPEHLREYDYFSYLENATRWNLAGDKFELFSRNRDGRDVRLVFEL